MPPRMAGSRPTSKTKLGSGGQTKKDEDRELGGGVAMQLGEAGKVNIQSKLIKYNIRSLGG